MLSRRDFLAGVAAGALAACSGSGSGPRPTSTVPGSSTTTLFVPSPDVAVLRLGSSLEHYLVSLYGLAAGSGLLHTPTIVEAAKYFSDHHADHAGTFEQATRDHRGQAFTSANPVVAETFKPRIDALADEADVVKLAYDVEQVLAATYISAVGNLQDLGLNGTLTRIAGVEARHVALLGAALTGLPSPLAGIPVRIDSPPVAPGGRQTAAGAIAAGTGV